MIRINRNKLAGWFLLLLAAAVFQPAALVAEEKPTNVILMMSDDQGWGDAGYNGHKILKTPHLDAMAAAGLRFNRFYSSSPVCSPTRGGRRFSTRINEMNASAIPTNRTAQKRLRTR